MTFEALGNIGDFVGGIGVFVTLVYLAIQIKGNTRAQQSSTLQALQSDANRLTMQIASNPQLAEVCLKSENSLGDLSPVERYQFDYYAMTVFEMHESAHHMYTQGQINPDIWALWEIAFKSELTPAFLSFWDEHKESYTPAFRQIVEKFRAAG